MPVPALVAALPWAAVWLMFGRLRIVAPSLDDVTPAEGGALSVIIPARDEATNIEACVRAILASTHALLEVIVVDDRSGDDTAAIVARLAAADPRVRLVRGAELPAGWFGKQWACRQGADAATGELLLFTDADTRHGPELHARAIGFLRAERADVVTVAPYQRCETFWERAVMPQFWLLLGFRYHAQVVNAARHRRDVVANGQFILFTRDAYERIGRHDAVRTTVAEDLALAQRAHALGLRLRLAYALKHMETRMYTSLGEIVRGWGKNVYLGGRASLPDEPLLRALVPVQLALAFLFWLLPPTGLAWALATGAGAWAAAWGAATALSLGFWLLIYWGMWLPPRFALTYPLGALVALWIALASSWRGARKVEWRGRVYGTETVVEGDAAG
ncbi:MAG: glycosyltransferase family 2 protein [Gemmatimonadales bacterium]|nr:glycosyltransferase family 2 protein [Gemmatimonadales bacterium]